MCSKKGMSDNLRISICLKDLIMLFIPALHSTMPPLCQYHCCQNDPPPRAVLYQYSFFTGGLGRGWQIVHWNRWAIYKVDSYSIYCIWFIYALYDYMPRQFVYLLNMWCPSADLHLPIESGQQITVGLIYLNVTAGGIQLQLRPE